MKKDDFCNSLLFVVSKVLSLEYNMDLIFQIKI